MPKSVSVCEILVIPHILRLFSQQLVRIFGAWILWQWNPCYQDRRTVDRRIVRTAGRISFHFDSQSNSNRYVFLWPEFYGSGDCFAEPPHCRAASSSLAQLTAG